MVSEVRRLRRERQMELTPGEIEAKKRAENEAMEKAKVEEMTSGSPSE